MLYYEVYQGRHYSEIFDLLVAQTRIAIDTGRVRPGKILDQTSGQQVTDTGHIETKSGGRTFWLTLQAPHTFLSIDETHFCQEVDVSWGIKLKGRHHIRFPIGNVWVLVNIPHLYSEWLRIMQEQPWEKRQGKFDSLLQQFIHEQREMQWTLATASHQRSVNSPLHRLPQEIYRKVSGMVARK